MPDLSETAVQAMTAPETGEVLLHLLSVSYNDEVILRVVDDKQALTSNDETYEACAFSVLLPDQSTDGAKTCRLQIDNTDIAIYKAIKTIASQSRNDNLPIYVTVSVVLASEPDTCVEGPLTFVLRNITANVQSITGELYDLYLQDRKFTALTYNPTEFPGLFF